MQTGFQADEAGTQNESHEASREARREGRGDGGMVFLVCLRS